ncbi:unnamed protein product [Fusarium fujikuroi]|uniref:Uncharacterized protein n=1 Tax=Fusarium fujikuroi TaxID=5127 RepID=A0A9Q9RIM3_FUSFU|nr:unnamed protein product [Fusarium fujikuroi]VTT65399.1 unnamed protein product [Fusarium fujikuroi]VZH88092.1 unnamed protein product [Fusarium fujikuroi]
MVLLLENLWSGTGVALCTWYSDCAGEPGKSLLGTIVIIERGIEEEGAPGSQINEALTQSLDEWRCRTA